MKIKRKLAQSVLVALLTGLLPAGNATVSKAGSEPASAAITSTSAETASSETAGGTTRAGYGLNNPTTDGDGVATWDCVWFGSYWQEDTNGDGKADKNDAKQPIKWLVLSVNGDDAFLLADKCLDYQKYNDNDTGIDIDVTWETCTMRSWLNGYGAGANQERKDYSSNNFLDGAFTSAEQSAIVTANVVNSDNPVYGTEGGNDTLDKVYLLSLDEVMNPSYGFNSTVYNTETRIAVKTAYVDDPGEAGWSLRSPGQYSNLAADVDRNGYVSQYGCLVHRQAQAVRPALHLNLSSDSGWSYAGTVISHEGEIRPAKVVSIKLKQKKRTVTVSWKKSTRAAGYQICYSTSKKWKGKKQKLCRKKKNKVTVKNLKQKKTYYFRVRAYLWDGEEKLYGEWSRTKKITMKKSQN